MLPIPPACKPSMERARKLIRYRNRCSLRGHRWNGNQAMQWITLMDCTRQETREILRALRTLRRQEEAGLLNK